MHIIHLDQYDYSSGGLAFQLYMAGAVCGADSYSYDRSKHRETGFRILVGVIQACLDHGLTGIDEVVNAASRVSRCRRSTVETLLSELSGDDPKRHLWFVCDGELFDLEDKNDNQSAPRVLLIA